MNLHKKADKEKSFPLFSDIDIDKFNTSQNKDSNVNIIPIEEESKNGISGTGKISDSKLNYMNKQKSISHSNLLKNSTPLPSSSVDSRSNLNLNNISKDNQSKETPKFSNNNFLKNTLPEKKNSYNPPFQNTQHNKKSTLIFKQSYMSDISNINFTLQKEIILSSDVNLQEKFESLMFLKLNSEKFELEKIIKVIIDNISIDLMINQLFIGELCSIIISNKFINLMANLEQLKEKIVSKDNKHQVVSNELENCIRMCAILKKKSDIIRSDKKLMKPEKYSITEKLNNIVNINQGQNIHSEFYNSKNQEGYNSAKNLPKYSNVYPTVVSPDENFGNLSK